MDIDTIVEKLSSLGASKVGVTPVAKVLFSTEFRAVCKRNDCGNWGKSYMCPPDCGDIDQLIDKLKDYETAVVYQTIWPLKDSYDVEGMAEGSEHHKKLTLAATKFLLENGFKEFVNLGTGGCHICKTCGKTTNEPCRHPDLAISAMSAHGINVSALAASAGMKYINGQNTVTYFGAVFLK